MLAIERKGCAVFRESKLLICDCVSLLRWYLIKSLILRVLEKLTQKSNLLLSEYLRR